MVDNYDIQDFEFDDDVLTDTQITDLIETSFFKQINEDMRLIKLYGGELELIEYSRTNPMNGLSEFQEGREMIVRAEQQGDNIESRDGDQQQGSILGENLKNPWIILLAVLSILCILLQQLNQFGQFDVHIGFLLQEGLGILISIIIVTLLNSYLDYTLKKRYSELDEKLRSCKFNTVQRDKKFVDRHPDEIKVGDIVQIMPGSTIPADGIIIKGHDIIVEESIQQSLTDFNLSLSKKGDIDQCEKEFDKQFKRYDIDEIIYASTIESNQNKSQYKNQLMELNQEATNIIGSNKHNLSNEIKNNEKISPIVLTGSTVLEGIGQMLVLAVGKNTFKSRKNIFCQEKQRNDSNLGIQLDEFVLKVKLFAKITITLLIIIRILRVIAEFILIQDFIDFMDNNWKLEISKNYYVFNENVLTSKLKIGDILQELMIMTMSLTTIQIIILPEGLTISSDIANALSSNQYINEGLLIKDVNALESIGSLDRLVLDFTRGFTKNQINFESCIINDHQQDISNNKYIIPNLKLQEFDEFSIKTLKQCLQIDQKQELDIFTDINVKQFVSSQISEQDIATILLLKAMKFEDEIKNDDQKIPKSKNIINQFIKRAIEKKLDHSQQTQQNTKRQNKNLNNKSDEASKIPCTVLHRVPFDTNLMFAIFMIQQYDITAQDQAQRIIIKGHPIHVKDHCNQQFEEGEKNPIPKNKKEKGNQGKFDTIKHIVNMQKNSLKVVSQAQVDIPSSEYDSKFSENLCDESLIERVRKNDLTFFFTYSIKDPIDPNAEKICDLMKLKTGIKTCIITKGDFKLANIITKKYLKEVEDKDNKEVNIEESLRSFSFKSNPTFSLDQDLPDKLMISGPYLIKIWEFLTTTESTEDYKQFSEASLNFIRVNLSKAKCIYNCNQKAKLYQVKMMKAIGDSCCVTGNQHEEKEVLQEADVGVKMGTDSSYSAIDASNIILEYGKIDLLMKAIIQGRNLIVNVKKFLEFRLSINLSLFIIMIVTILLNKNNPFNLVQLMIIQLIKNTFSAVMLAYQNPRESNSYLKFEINKKDPLVSSLMYVSIISNALLISLICLFIFQFGDTFLQITLDVSASSIALTKPIISGNQQNIDGTPNFLKQQMGHLKDPQVVYPYLGSIHTTIIFNSQILFNIFNMLFIKIKDEETIGNTIQQNLQFWGMMLLFVGINVLFTMQGDQAGFSRIEFTHWIWCVLIGLSNLALNLIINFTSFIIKKQKLFN